MKIRKRTKARLLQREAEKHPTRSGGDGMQHDLLVAEIHELRDRLRAVMRLNEQLQHQMEQMIKWRFGRRSERVDDPLQGALFDEPDPVSDAPSDEGSDDEDEERPPKRPRRKGSGRQQIPDHLKRREEVLLPASADRVCCGQPKQQIGEDVSERLDYEPASLFVHRLVRPVLSCGRCRGNVAQAPLPSRPIEKGLAGNGLLAQVVVSKFADHLPLNRQESMLRRHGAEISRQTMSRWCQEVGDLLEPVAEAIRRQVFTGDIVNVDDTTIVVNDRTTARGSRRGHIWSWRGIGGEIYYEYTNRRTRDGPMARLGNWTGYVQADACSVYDQLFREQLGAKEVGRWAHARRKFVAATTTDGVRAAQGLAYIRQLYRIERDLKKRGASCAEIEVERQEKSQAVINTFIPFLKEQQRQVLPKSPIGRAIGYVINHNVALSRYVEDGRLTPDNNAAERDLRKVVLGRVNWLFIGHPSATKSATVLMTIVQSCRSVGVEPFAYLRDLLDRIADWPVQEIEQLTPRAWKLAQEEAERAAA
jgi:transposase